jgi:hypothetical protein
VGSHGLRSSTLFRGPWAFAVESGLYAAHAKTGN